MDIRPGYDGEYGRIKILNKEEIGLLSGQMSLLNEKAGGSAGKKQNKKSSEYKTAQHTTVSADKPGISPQLPEDIFNSLNTEQREAVYSPDCAIAVVAGPGTGKTKTLISRIVYLVEKCGVPPSQITAVTFTNKAAGEMRSRIEQHFGNKQAVRSMAIGTFHSIALKLLSGRTKGGVTVIDEQSALTVVEDILSSLGLSSSPRDVLRGISLIKNGALPAESPDVPPGVYGSYCAQLKELGALDYDDILVNALKLFEDESASLGAFTHLLVDEFQDINAVQYRLIKVWSKNSKSVFIIGDPDQSIYGFRGSDPRCFDRFFEDFPHTKNISLTRNYRSAPEIIRCAQSVIRDNAVSRIPQEAGRKSGAKVRRLVADDTFSEALFIAKEINRMVGGIEMIDSHSGRKGPASGCLKGFPDIAVLYRTNRQAYAIEQCLLKEGIPYIVAGRDEFLSDPQVLRTAAFFRLLLDPKNLISLRIVLRGTGIHSSSVKSIFQSFTGSGGNIESLSGILEQHDAGNLSELLRKYEPLVRVKKPSELIEAWAGDNSLTGAKCLEMLLNTSVMHEDMSAFLSNLALGRESDIVRSGRKHYSLDAVTLSTLHGAKGLEFPVVFLCGLTDGLIPFKGHFGNCSLDEERRLFYVGATRAKDELVLLTSHDPSPFLAQLPEEFLLREIVQHKQNAQQLSFLDIR